MLHVLVQDKTTSTPDLELVGHTATAQYAVGMCTSEPLVASGGQDTNVSHLPYLQSLNMWLPEADTASSQPSPNGSDKNAAVVPPV